MRPMSADPTSDTAVSAISSRRSSAGEDHSLSLYLHFPFCSRLCGYCDFHKELFSRRREELYFQALAIDTALAAEELYKKAYTTKRIALESVYIGGGTPSLISPKLFERWLAQLRELFDFSDNIEFTVEVNPESANQENLALFSECGVNRLSVGVQSFDTHALKALDRRHKVADTLRVFYTARALGIENISADLIFGLPEQTLQGLHHDVTELLELEPSHISYYQLTVKENTPLAKQVSNGEVTLPDDDTMATFYRAGSEFFIEQGYERYEVSSFAKDGKQGRHNTRYWSNKPYLALGPGAHGFTGEHRYAIVSDSDIYVSALLEERRRPLVWDKLTKRDRMLEDIMLALRTAKGLDIRLFRKRHGQSPKKSCQTREYQKLLDDGHLESNHGYLRLSDDALALADEIIARLVV